MWIPESLHSQNYEDLYLWRLFNTVGNGFYIDAGAWSPVKESVTKIFYDQGWSGINIEPIKEFFQDFPVARPRDVNLELAVSSGRKTGLRKIKHVKNSGLSSLVPDDDHNDPGAYVESLYRSVQVVTLRQIVDTYCNQEIHFLKLDVEGEELEVLLGLDIPTLPELLRPKIILSESTLPCEKTPSSTRSLVFDYLSANGYSHLFFDGLNDYYCLSHLASVYKPKMLPPNVFDPCNVSCSYVFGGRRDCESSLSLLSESSRRRDSLEAELIGLKVELERIALQAGHEEDLRGKLAASLRRVVVLENQMRAMKVRSKKMKMELASAQQLRDQLYQTEEALECSLSAQRLLSRKLEWLRRQRLTLLKLAGAYARLSKCLLCSTSKAILKS